MPAPGGGPPFRHEEAERIARSASPGTGKRYGLQRVCRIFGVPRSTAYDLKAREAVPVDQRPVPRKRGPLGAGSDEELVAHIRRVLAESPFHGEGYRKAWARLRHRGIRTASERVRRLMRGHHLQAPRRGGHAHGPKAHDGTITTEEPDTMGGADMTTTVTTGERSAHVFVAVDHGSNSLRDDFQRELRFLGMESSPSFVREPEGNGCAERFIRTLKEQLLWVQTFAAVAELVAALSEFKRTYNERWVIRRHGRRTPSQVRRDLVGGKSAAA